MNSYIYVSVTYTLVPTVSYMKASPHESSFDTTPHSFSMSLDFYAIKLDERLSVSLCLWSFPDLSLTAWEPPAKTSNEILVLTVVTGEGGECYSLISSPLFSLRWASSEDLPPFTLAGNCSISLFSLSPLASLLLFLSVLLCLFFSLTLAVFLSFLSGYLWDLFLSLCCGVSVHCCSVCGWGTKVKLPPWINIPTAAEEEVHCMNTVC